MRSKSIRWRKEQRKNTVDNWNLRGGDFLLRPHFHVVARLSDGRDELLHAAKERFGVGRRVLDVKLEQILRNMNAFRSAHKDQETRAAS